MTDVETSPGLCMSGHWDGEIVRLGSARFMEVSGLTLPKTGTDTFSIVYGAMGDAVVAAFHLSDPARPEAKGVVSALNADAVHTVLISGVRE